MTVWASLIVDKLHHNYLQHLNSITKARNELRKKYS